MQVVAPAGAGTGIYRQAGRPVPRLSHPCLLMSPGRVVPAPLGSWSRQLRHQLKHGLDVKELTSHETKHLRAERPRAPGPRATAREAARPQSPSDGIRRDSPAGPGPPDQNRWPGHSNAAAIEVQVTNLHPRRPRISPSASARGSGAGAMAGAVAGERRAVLCRLGFVRWEGFPSSSRVIVCPLPTTDKSVPQGHVSKTGGIEKRDILENLVNSRLVSSHFLKRIVIFKKKKKELQAVLANLIHLRMATGANEINCHLVSDSSPDP